MCIIQFYKYVAKLLRKAYIFQRNIMIILVFAKQKVNKISIWDKLKTFFRSESNTKLIKITRCKQFFINNGITYLKWLIDWLSCVLLHFISQPYNSGEIIEIIRFSIWQKSEPYTSRSPFLFTLGTESL